MAYEQPGFAISLMSTGDITQFTAVKVDNQGRAETAGLNENPIVGIAQMPAEDDDPETIRVMVEGVTPAIGKASIDAGATVGVDADDGKLVTSASNVVGIALTACGSEDEEFSLLLATTSDKGV